MQNQNFELYKKYNEQRLSEKMVPSMDMMKVLENYRRSVDFYNNFGIKSSKKDSQKQ